MVKQADVYELTGEEPWVDFPDPGHFFPHVDDMLNTNQQQDAEAIYAEEGDVCQPDQHANPRDQRIKQYSAGGI